LSGAEGLVLDCPFVLPCIYDPAEKISVEFDLYTLKSPFFIAFDIDGLQVAVLSADPTSKAYGERWRFPADVPMLKDERKPPTVNWYGRGRGIAFHAGRGFGDPTDVKSWKWPRAGQGRNFERWGKLEKERDPQVFAFEPRAQMRVRIVRERGRVSLYVRDKLIDSREEPEWALRGATSDSNPRIQMGTGRIQIWTWTPIAIDDLRISGRVLDRWR
jgi:hypothetical protein